MRQTQLQAWKWGGVLRLDANGSTNENSDLERCIDFNHVFCTPLCARNLIPFLALIKP
jgi:hypothetical protein